MKKLLMITAVVSAITLISAPAAFSFFGSKFKTLEPENGTLRIPVDEINDGNAHFFKTRAANGTMVAFFALKSKDGVIRSAIDACDVCYRSGKGYVQDGDFMVCENCKMRFQSSRINVAKGGCNPAPLERNIQGSYLVINMADINKNSWYCKYKNL